LEFKGLMPTSSPSGDRTHLRRPSLYQRGGKRLLDVVCAGALLGLLSPLFLLIAAMIKLTSKGPVLFRQARAGRGGRSFHILKFRTMHAEAIPNGPSVTSEDDPRVTRLGRLLRRWKIDELPQLWNVLVGEMSLVGPRPDTLAHVAAYTADQQENLKLRPGITSLASICHREEGRLLAQAEDKEHFYLNEILPRKMLLDGRYHDNMTFSFDLKILLLTFALVFFPGHTKIRTVKIFRWEVNPWSRPVQLLIDLFIFEAALFGAFWIRLEGSWPGYRIAQLWIFFLILPVLRALMNLATGVYNKAWRYFSEEDGLVLAFSLSVCTLVVLGLRLFLPGEPDQPPYLRLPLTVIALELLLSLVGTVSARVLRRYLYKMDIRYRPPKSLAAKRILIANAGPAARRLLQELRYRPEYEVVAFVDDDPGRIGHRIGGIRVAGTTEAIASIAHQELVDMVMLWQTSREAQDPPALRSACEAAGVELVVVRSFAHILEEGLRSNVGPVPARHEAVP
jgi:lipopolysaccharide/colanic/teichoic acid biosynthesis glycosyltransferase